MRRQAIYLILLAAAPVLAAAILYGPEVIKARSAADRAAHNLGSLEMEWQALTAAADAEIDPAARLEYQRFEGPLLSDISRAADIWKYHDLRFREASAMFWRLPVTFFALSLLIWGCAAWIGRYLGPGWRSEVSELAKHQLTQLGSDVETERSHDRVLGRF